MFNYNWWFIVRVSEFMSGRFALRIWMNMWPHTNTLNILQSYVWYLTTWIKTHWESENRWVTWFIWINVFNPLMFICPMRSCPTSLSLAKETFSFWVILWHLIIIYGQGPIRPSQVKRWRRLLVQGRVKCQDGNECVLQGWSPMSWWRHQMEALSALLAICTGNSPVTGEFPAQKPVTRGFDVFLGLRLNKRLSKQSWGWWFETPSRSL